MVRISGIKIKCGVRTDKLPGKIEDKLGLARYSIDGVSIVKESVDARKKPDVFRVFTVDLHTSLDDEFLLKKAAENKIQASVSDQRVYALSACERNFNSRPVVAGFGPCGIFAALAFAEYGLKPIVIERGSCMEERIRDVEAFWGGGAFKPESNVQFGEGGAGTFSDGKLTTGTNYSSASYVLKAFVDAGASPDIMYRQMPHIGSDVLRRVVVELRKKIEALGGEVRFNTALKALDIKDGKLCGVRLSGDEYIKTDTLVMALGHSARDSFEELLSEGLLLEQKQFSMGVRIEHSQKQIDISQYGKPAAELGLDPSTYKLAVKTSDGRGVYTFCMCPGGYVVASASEEGGVVTNGMSYSRRDGENANSAVLVDVRTSDFGSDHPLAGMYLQRSCEKKAYEIAGRSFKAPSQRLGDFMKVESAVYAAGGKPGREGANSIAPTYAPGVEDCEIADCLPPFVASSLREAFPLFGKKLHGFDSPDALLTGPETRSSSPVRIKRDSIGRALMKDGSAVEGLYPGGEGAGYAGGIMSSASDGIKLAELAVKYRESDAINQ